MPARLTVHLAGRPARVFLLSEHEDYVLGRDPACNLLVDDDWVSRRHAGFAFAGGGWQVTDLGSKNGTLMDGQPAATALPLGDRCWLSLGGLLAGFERLTEQQSLQESEAQAARRRSTLAACRRIETAVSLDALVRSLLDSMVRL